MRDALDFGDDPELPTTDELLAMVREGSYDVPELAERLGLSEGHVRLLLSTVAEEGSDG